jgi:hypothetical protein
VPVVVAGRGGRVDPALAGPLEERGAAHPQAPIAVDTLELVQSPPRAVEIGEPQRHDGVFHGARLRSVRAGGFGLLPVVELALQLLDLRVDGGLVALAA